MGKKESCKETEVCIELLSSIIDKIAEMFGKRIALSDARKLPLQLSPEGEVTGYYGEGKTVLKLLVKAYEKDMGKACYPWIKKELEKVKEKEDVEISEEIEEMLEK